MRRVVSVGMTAMLTVVAGLAMHPKISEARVTKIVIAKRQPPLFNGQPFGEAGPYEELKGTATGELDPNDRRNALITDITLAPRNRNGKVEYVTTFTLRKPVDMRRASGTLIYEVNNRGSRGLPSINVGGDPGDGFLYNMGHVYLWSGWQGDISIAAAGQNREGIDVPIARNTDGSSITGPVLARFTDVSDAPSTQSLPGVGRTPASLDTTRATLTSVARESNVGVRTGVATIAPSDWAFADCRTTPFPGTPDPARVCLKSGFRQDVIYELVYTAKDPLVLGIGMAAIRDVVSFFRRESRDVNGTANPIAGTTTWVVGYGVSQSGRLVKNFILLGLNEDEAGRIVWDGADAHIAGALGQFNVRFGQPGNMANIFEPNAEGPLWWADSRDVARGRPAGGLLHRCRATKTCPKIFDDFSGVEMWYGRAGVGIAGTAGTDDIPLPQNVRRYYLAGAPHYTPAGGWSLSQPPPQPGVALSANPNSSLETRRALLVALIDWVTRNVAPPPSTYPRVVDGTLVPATTAAMQWPTIPGVPTPDNVINPAMDYDYGPQFSYADQSGAIANAAPTIRKVIPTLVPKVDADGNDLAGAKSLLMRLPLGTYLGWNPVAAGALKGNQRGTNAGYIPFAKTRAERLASGDPRLSLEERYGSIWNYYYLANVAVNDLVAQRFLLPDDARRLLGQLVADMLRTGDLPQTPVGLRPDL